MGRWRYLARDCFAQCGNQGLIKLQDLTAGAWKTGYFFDISQT